MPQSFRRSAVVLCYDTAVSVFCFSFACLLYDVNTSEPMQLEAVAQLMPEMVLTAGTTYYLCGLHRRVWSYTSISDLIAIVRASSWLTVALIPPMLIVEALLPLPILPMQWFMLIVILSASRLAYRSIKAGRSAGTALPAPGAKVPVLMYGCNPMTSVFIHAVQSGPLSALRVVGIVDDVGDRVGRYIGQIPVLGHGRELDRVLIDLAACGISPQRMIVTAGRISLTQETRACLEAAQARHGLQIDYLHDVIGISVLPPSAPPPVTADLPGSYERLRRFVDVVGSAIALVALSPLLALVALAVLVDLGPPLLFRQMRPGRDMHPFTLYKFRTMRAPTPTRSLCRITSGPRALGRFLRRAPGRAAPALQRAARRHVVHRAAAAPAARPAGDVARRAAVRPGITGWAQVNGGHKLPPPRRWRSTTGTSSTPASARSAHRRVDARTILFGEQVSRSDGRSRGERGHTGVELESGGHGRRCRRAAPAAAPVVNRYFHPDDCGDPSAADRPRRGARAERRLARRCSAGRQHYDDPARRCWRGQRRFGGRRGAPGLAPAHFGRFEPAGPGRSTTRPSTPAPSSRCWRPPARATSSWSRPTRP